MRVKSLWPYPLCGTRQTFAESTGISCVTTTKPGPTVFHTVSCTIANFVYCHRHDCEGPVASQHPVATRAAIAKSIRMAAL